MEIFIYIGLIIFTLIVLGGFFFISNYDSPNKINYISIDAQWFEFNPNEIRVKQGELVTIKVNNLDVIHGITIPELGVSGNEVITFNANKKGEFIFYCNRFCGVDHKDMVGSIIVE